MLQNSLFKLAATLCIGMTVASCTGSPPETESQSTSPVTIADTAKTVPEVGQLELIASLTITPGNVTVSRSGRIFASVHGLRRGDAQLIEIFPGEDNWQPFPNAEWNAAPGSGEDVFNTTHGAIVDSQDRLWVIDHGNWMPDDLPVAQPKLVAFDIDTGELVFRMDFDSAAAPPGQLLQDLAVDEAQGFVYLADSGERPGILVVDIDEGRTWRWEGHPSLQAEDLDVIVEGRAVAFLGADSAVIPARIPVNPITLSADGETLFYGAMSGSKLYGIDAALLRSQASSEELAEAVMTVGDKPVSDGISTDAEGNHFISNLGDNSIDVLSSDGELSRLVEDDRFLWIDSLRFGADSWLYFNVNQLHRASAFTEGAVDAGEPPYQIFRAWTGTQGIPGR